MQKTYNFKAKLWLYKGKGAWHFITLPVETAKDIDYYFFLSKKGWGSLPVLVTIGNTTWKTSIFPQKEEKTYILPIKKEVRENEDISVNDNIALSITLSQ